MKSDAMEYSVDLVNTEGQDRVNKIKLTVRRKCHRCQKMKHVDR